MTIMHMILWLGALAVLILSIGVAKGSRQAAYDALADRDLGPGDIDAGHYLASGRIAWAKKPAARQKRRPAASHRGVAYRFAMR
jgi:hypothetical protein